MTSHTVPRKFTLHCTSRSCQTHSWGWHTHHTEYHGKLSQLQRAASYTFGQAMKQSIHRHFPGATHQLKVRSIIVALCVMGLGLALQGVKTSSARSVDSAES